jgi:hypothetical protein
MDISKVDLGLRESMEKSLVNFVQWAKATDLNLLPDNFDFAQEYYSKDKELIKKFLKLSAKQYNAIAEFSKKVK